MDAIRCLQAGLNQIGNEVSTTCYFEVCETAPQSAKHGHEFRTKSCFSLHVPSMQREIPEIAGKGQSPVSEAD